MGFCAGTALGAAGFAVVAVAGAGFAPPGATGLAAAGLVPPGVEGLAVCAVAEVAGFAAGVVPAGRAVAGAF